MAVSKAYPRYHRELSLSTVYALLEDVRALTRELKPYKARRVYIPKGGDK